MNDRYDLDRGLDQFVDQDADHDAGRYADHPAAIDWAGTFRLALVVSIVAAFAAMLLVGVLPETTIVVAIIVAGTAASWYQLERRPAHAGS